MAYLPSKMTLRPEFVWNESFWTPELLGSDLALWLDADDVDTITLNGSNVSQWDDKSGNGYNATQASASAQPVYSATGFFGKPTVENTSTDSLQFGATSLGRNVSGITCAIVGLHPTGVTFINSASEIFISTPTGGATTRFAMTPTSSSAGGVAGRYGLYGRRLDDDTFAVVSSSTDSLANRGNPWIRIGQRAYSDGVANHWTDGTQDLTNAVVGTQTAGNTSDTDATVSTIFAGGASVPDGTQLSEIVLTHSTMTNANRQKLEGYLAWKWGLVANLPVSHPYKIAPPQRNI